MRIFRVTKRALCFGTGNPSPEWVRDVRAESRDEILRALAQYPNTQLISVSFKEIDSYSIDEFHGFMRAVTEQETLSRDVTDEEVREILGNL